MADIKLDSLLKESGVTKVIYSWVMPETRRLVDKILGASPSSEREAFHDMYDEAWTQKQDSAHLDFFKKWEAWTKPVLNFPAKEFPHSYPTGGASEALRESIHAYGVRARVKKFHPTIHVFEGEYEGFKAYAEASAIPVVIHSRANWQDTLDNIGPNDQFYISHPSAIDGKVWPEFDNFVCSLNEVQPAAQVMLDLTYVGCIAKDFHINADHPNIHTVFFSLSKPMGAYYHRIGGMYSREPLPGLFGNQWFKNLFALRLGREFMDTYGVQELPRKYQPVQQQAVARVNEQLGLALEPCDVLLIAHAEPTDKPSDLERYLTRGTGENAVVRVCLTPLMAHIVNPKLYPEARARYYEKLAPK